MWIFFFWFHVLCYFQKHSSRFMLFPTLKKNWCQKKIRGWGCGFFCFFFRKTILSDFTFYAIFNIKKKYWKVPLHLLVKWEVVSPNSREGQLQSISIIFIILVVILYFKIQNNYFSFNVFFVVFFVCWKYCKVPLHLQLLVKWEVVSPNSRYRECYHEIGNIEKFHFTYWLNGRWFLQIVDIHVGNFDMKLTGRWFPQIVDRDSGNLYPIYI